MALIPKKRLSEVGNRDRETYTYTTQLLALNQTESFELDPGGSTVIVQRLSLDVPCVVEVWAAPDRNTLLDPNPYTFSATADHLIDDGQTMLKDGTTIKTRQYSMFVNMESPKQSKFYGYITNTGTETVAITLTLSFLTVED